MRRERCPRALTTIVAAALIIPLGAAVAAADTSVDSVEASSYGVFASVSLNGIGASVSATPSASVPSSGGSQSKSLASKSLGVLVIDVLDLGLMNVSASGSTGVDGSAEAEATIADVELVNQIITADKVTVSCDAGPGGTSGATQLVGARVASIGNLSASPAPNTSLSIADVGTLWLNRQTTDSSGTLTVTGLQLVLNLNLLLVTGTGTINVGRAECGVDTVDVPSPTTTSTSTSTTSTTSPSSPTTTAPTTSTTAPKSTTTTTRATTTTTSGASTTSTAGDTTTSIPVDVKDSSVSDDDVCFDVETGVSPDAQEASVLGAMMIGGSSQHDGETDGMAVVLNALILLVVATLGAVGGFWMNRLGLFDRSQTKS